MEQTHADVSVIICAYTEDRWDDLIAAVASLHQQTLRPREIIVVIDDNSSLFARSTVQFPDIRVISNNEVRGLSGARNSGIAIAQGAIIAFMDEDAVAEPTWVQHLVVLYQDSTVMGAGGAIVPNWIEGRPRWFPSEFHWVVGCTYRGMPTSAAPVRNVIGCNMSFRRELFAQVGGFRHGMGRIGTKPLGCEETELCIRALQAWPDRTVLYEPRARVHHRVPAWRATWAYFIARCYSEGLSKAQVSQLVGANDGLSSEWTYTLQTLPSGVLQGLVDLAYRGDAGGLGRAAAICLGLAVTTVGYLRGRLQSWFGKDATVSTTESNPSQSNISQPHLAQSQLTITQPQLAVKESAQ